MHQGYRAECVLDGKVNSLKERVFADWTLERAASLARVHSDVFAHALHMSPMLCLATNWHPLVIHLFVANVFTIGAQEGVKRRLGESLAVLCFFCHQERKVFLLFERIVFTILAGHTFA